MNPALSSPCGPDCRAAVFHAPGQPLQLQSFPVPVPEDDEAVVRISCCTVCGSDLHTLTGARAEVTPSILGHEAVGFVERLGPRPLRDVAGVPLNLGDRVTWSTVIACGTCDRCRAGLPQKCRQLSKYGHDRALGRQALNGGLAERILLRRGSAVVKLPDDLPDEIVCPANCATATVAAMYRCAEPVAGQRVLIFGAGMLGLTAAAMAAARGACAIAVLDTQPRRLELAREFGATATLAWTADGSDLSESLRELTGQALWDIVLEVCGAPAAVAAACQQGDIGARIVLAGSVMPTPDIPLNPEQVIRRCLTIRGMHNYTPADLLAAVMFLQEHGRRFPFAKLVANTFPLDRVNEAVAHALEQRPIRIGIRP
ncbi:MAG: zinc-binding dehydrogenase [Planctomycetaceae bacterium]|nr:zinc-binding dehydrogenase [Planctomycetaceae bacterium]